MIFVSRNLCRRECKQARAHTHHKRIDMYIHFAERRPSEIFTSQLYFLISFQRDHRLRAADDHRTWSSWHLPEPSHAVCSLEGAWPLVIPVFICNLFSYQPLKMFTAPPVYASTNSFAFVNFISCSRTHACTHRHANMKKKFQNRKSINVHLITFRPVDITTERQKERSISSLIFFVVLIVFLMTHGDERPCL